MKALILFLSVLLFSLACGSGGGSSSVSTAENPLRFKASDALAFKGTWYAVQYSLDGTQLMPIDLRELKIMINIDGSWSGLLKLSSLGSSTVTQSAISSENEASNDFTINSFAYVESSGSITITENFTNNSDGLTHDVSMTVIEDSVDSAILGDYTFSSGSIDGVDFSSSVTSGTMTINLSGTATTELTRIDTTTAASGFFIAANNGNYYIIDSASNNEVGSYTFIANTLTFTGVESTGSTYTNSWIKQ